MEEQNLNLIKDAVIRGDTNKVAEETQSLLEKGVDPYSILEKGLKDGMEIVGMKYENKEYFLPDMLMAAQTVQVAQELIKPYISTVNNREVKSTIIMGTVEGDIHNIGKDIVIIALEASGFNVVDLGVDVKAEKFVESVKQNHPMLIGCSALITPTMINIEKVINALELEKDGFKNKIKVMVGGAPLSKEYADSVGADYYGKNAYDAVTIANKILKDRGDR